MSDRLIEYSQVYRELAHEAHNAASLHAMLCGSVDDCGNQDWNTHCNLAATHKAICRHVVQKSRIQKRAEAL
jgi:hypothetical protein